MIEVRDPEAVLGRFWDELRSDPALAGLAALVPSDRPLGWADAIPLFPAVMRHLGTPPDQLRVLDAAARAYLRAADLHISED